jgi:hypothetical protein
MSTTLKRLEALERRARKPVRVVDALRILLTDDEPSADDMALVLRCAQTSHVVRALLDDDDPQPA